jgi:hypothetical protein
VPIVTAILVILVVAAWFLLPQVQGLNNEIGGLFTKPTPKPTAGPTAGPTAKPTAKPTPGHPGGGGGGRPTPKPPPPVTVGVKPYIRGLIDRAGAPPTQYRSSFSAYVVNVGWDRLQLSRGGPIASNNLIDQAIVQVRRLNADGGPRLTLKIRIYSGIHAPAWAKSMDGPPVAVEDIVAHRGGTVGRFWLADFGAAYADFERKLAARYDTVAEIGEVTVSRCMTVYAEPFMRQTNNPATVKALLAAGFTTAADHACETQQIDAHRVWLHTRSGLAFNPYQVINANGTVGTDLAFTQSVMLYCRRVLGSRCVLENNSLHPPVTVGGPYGAMHTTMRSLGVPVSLQTAGLLSVAQLVEAVSDARQFAGANAIEAPQVFSSYSPASLGAMNRTLGG